MQLQRTVLITGGSRGIGAEIAQAFHRQGDRVLLASRNDSGLAAALGAQARFVACDVCQPEALAAAAQVALEWTGQLDIWINNAGFSQWRSLAQVTPEFWQQMIDTNLKGSFFGAQVAAAVLPAGGCIINISSLAGKRGSANNAVYCASKFGVTGLTQALAKELGPRGIRVNAVCPVYIETPGLAVALAEPAAPPKGAAIATYLQEFALANAALGRLPTATEVAQVCLFLASPAAAAITGQSINVDCGVLPQ